MKGKRKKITFLLLASAVLLFDQFTKAIFLRELRLGESAPLIKNVLHFTLVFNTGAAFGIGKSWNHAFILISVAAVCLIALNLMKNGSSERFAFILILSGALGNLIDRLRFGYVIDFIDFRVWPVFNVADSAITTGAAWIFLRLFFAGSRQKDNRQYTESGKQLKTRQD